MCGQWLSAFGDVQLQEAAAWLQEVKEAAGWLQEAAGRLVRRLQEAAGSEAKEG